jgi:hypothetical protein
MTRRLHDIAGDVLALEDLLLETGGEWTPEVEALFAEVEGSLESKVDGYAALIAEWTLDAEKWKAEEARVAGHRKARENAARRLKDRLCQEMLFMGRPKVETERFKVAVQYGPATVAVLVPATELPEEYRREIPASVEPDKKALADALKGGKELPGVAELIPGSPHVRVR